jgi:hypothetical protein
MICTWQLFLSTNAIKNQLWLFTKEAERAMKLTKEREQHNVQLQKQKLEGKLRVENIDTKFSASKDEKEVKIGAVGLFAMAEMKAKQGEMICCDLHSKEVG